MFRAQSTTEDYIRANSKKARLDVKDLTTVKQRKATTFQGRSGKCHTEERELQNLWTEYYSELYNRKANGDQSLLNCPKTDIEEDHTILRKEVEAVLSLKKVSWG